MRQAAPSTKGNPSTEEDCVRSSRIQRLVRSILTSCSPPALVPIYAPLPFNNSIRLLRIHPGHPTQILRVTLEAARLDDSLPTYEAISYVWSLKRGQGTVTVNGIRKDDVSTNLHEALVQLRRVKKSRVVWVDALCINQKDDNEMALQVAKMHDIYARAENVLIWLGTDDYGAAQDAFGVLCAMVNEKRPDTDDIKSFPVSYEVLEKGKPVKGTNTKLVPGFENGRAWENTMLFFSNMWFLRMWVLQEIVLAQRAIVIWGSAYIDWDIIGSALYIINDDHMLSSLFECRNRQNAFFMHHLRCQQKSNDDKKNHPFLHLLDIGRGLDVTNARDKVYGLLGFPTMDKGDKGVFIEPDYKSTITEIYTKVARILLEKEGCLNVLSFAVHSGILEDEREEIEGREPTTDEKRRQDEEEELKHLPSWVPNWNGKHIVHPFLGFRVKNWHHAGTARKMEILPCGNSSLLCVKGVVVDIVQSLGDTVPFVERYKSAGVMRGMVEWCMRTDVDAPTLAATLTGGRDCDNYIISDIEQHLADFAALLEDLNIDGSAAWPDTAPYLTTLASQQGDSNRAKEHVWRHASYRAPFITKKGCLGLGPGAAKAGDAVVVLWGGQMPFVLREECGESWSLVGEAYMGGIMNGEVEGFLGEADCKERVFKLI